MWRSPASIVMSNGILDSFFYLDGGNGEIKFCMKPGNTYRVSADVYVPSVTGLVPDSDRGLKIVAFWKNNGRFYEKRSNAPLQTDVWEHLSVTFSLPPETTEAFIRLYIGFKEKGKFVCYDNILLEKID